MGGVLLCSCETRNNQTCYIRPKSSARWLKIAGCNLQSKKKTSETFADEGLSDKKIGHLLVRMPLATKSYLATIVVRIDFLTEPVRRVHQNSCPQKVELAPSPKIGTGCPFTAPPHPHMYEFPMITSNDDKVWMIGGRDDDEPQNTLIFGCKQEEIALWTGVEGNGSIPNGDGTHGYYFYHEYGVHHRYRVHHVTRLHHEHRVHHGY